MTGPCVSTEFYRVSEMLNGVETLLPPQLSSENPAVPYSGARDPVNLLIW